ncbi:hypothetical protein KY284_035957 [Solanum tuberosum]|nr:hypothetical protein KY284_035957 [Solanum tuberosum]
MVNQLSVISGRGVERGVARRAALGDYLIPKRGGVRAMEEDMVYVFDVIATVSAFGLDIKTSLLQGMVGGQPLVIHHPEQSLHFVMGFCSPNPAEPLIWY